MGGLLGCSLIALLLAGSQVADRRLDTVVQDDALMLHRSQQSVRATARTLAELGVDRVRITAGWSVLAPGRRPPGFDPEDSRTYPNQDAWHRLDRALDAVRDAGLQPMVDVAFWAPRWAVPRRSANPLRHRYIPDAREFGRFTKALADRYSGDFREHGVRLPRVRLWTIWNEPNEASFLEPQWKRDSTAPGGWRPFSPHVYRAMYVQAHHALKAASPTNDVLIGGTSAKGSRVPGEGGVPPLDFLRVMACADGAGRRLRVAQCRGYQPLHADGYAHHPYSLKTTPGTSDPDPGDAPIADTARLTATLAQLHASGRIRERWPVYLTEYGYETGPPDPFVKTTLEQQASYLSWASFLAFKSSDVRMMGQFLLRDVDPRDSGYPVSSRRRWRDWQTGLLFFDGSPKPAAQAFKLPLHAEVATAPDGTKVLLLFGGVRPNRHQEVVRVERQDPATGMWAPVRTAGHQCDEAEAAFLTDSEGWFVRTAQWDGPGSYRLGWKHAGAYEYGPALTL